MQHLRMAAAVATVLLAAASGASAQTATPPMVMTMAPMPQAPALALDARSLRGTRTPAGYRISGQALAKDACTAARFSQFLGNVFPPQFDIVQYRRPGTTGLRCIARLTWVTAVPLNVTSTYPPRYVSARTRKGITRVPIR